MPTCYIAQDLPELTQAAVADTDVYCSIAQDLPELDQEAVSGAVVTCAIAQDLPEITQDNQSIMFAMTIALAGIHSEGTSESVIAITTVLCEAMTVGVMGKDVVT